ncbi:MAG: Gfo/Idh/MocA family oxidoreductase [Gemmatimonadota bacterium]|nr:Gfo/Idh/MocA family oxidoreductase [Gemmatimonadota bacterium]
MARKKVTRREFVAESGAIAASAAFAARGFPMIVPRHVLGGPGYRAPSDTVNFAVAGFGGMGSGNAQELVKTENLVAVCDVDMAFSKTNVDGKLRPNREGVVRPEATKLNEQFEKAAKYADFREMLEKEKGIDGVVVATPDHAHAVIAKAAMDLGKHVYVQKPLTWSVHEARALRAAAIANPKIITQMGNQGHSSEGARQINEWIAAGVIGPVREVHVWTNRPVGYWPQGVPRPNPNALSGPNAPRFGNGWSLGRINTTIAAEMGANAAAMPDGLRWDLYLGPVAEDIAYHPIYHPFNWRGWLDFGMGALGDMGAHLIDHPFWALDLGLPTSIEATSTAFGMATLPPLDPNAAPNTSAGRPRQVPASYPLATNVHYQFAARGNLPPVKLYWFDGGLYPPRPDLLPDTEILKGEGGVIFYGEKGILINDTYGANPRCYPETAQAAANAVPKSMPRIDWSHELNWAKAIRGEAKASSPFEYSARLTETMLLGVAALRAGQGRKVYYDGEKGEFTNAPEANQYLTRAYRNGWGM